MSRSAIVQDPIDVASVIAEVSAPAHGAVASFIGTVRDTSDGRSVVALEYSSYREMAEREMAAIVREACALEAGVDVVALHRVGELAVGEMCVVVAAAHAHRASAFAACRYVIEEIKKRVPIWKRERYRDGSDTWVNACGATDGTDEARASHPAAEVQR